MRPDHASAYLAAVPGSAEGGRDGATLAAACKLVERFSLPDDDLADALLAWNREANAPPLSDADVTKCLRSAHQRTQFDPEKAAGAHGAPRQGSSPQRPVQRASEPPAAPLPTEAELAKARTVLCENESEPAQHAREYLLRCGIDPAACGWGLGHLTAPHAAELHLPHAQEIAGPRLLVPVYLPDGVLADVRRYRGPFGAGRDSDKLLPWAKGHGSAKPYGWHNLPADAELVVWGEGEKDREALVAAGFSAVSNTCGAGSAAKVARELAAELVTGRRFVVLFDADKAGRDYAPRLAEVLAKRGATVAVAAWPETLPDGSPTPDGFDAADWLASFDRAGLAGIIAAATPHEAAAPAEQTGSRPPRSTAPDMDLAQEFAHLHRADWMPVEGRQWYRWLKGAWHQRDADEVKSLLWGFVHERHVQGATQRLVSSVYEAACVLQGWRQPTSALNTNTELVNLRNGVYDLSSGKLLPHDRALLQTVQRPFDFDPDARCPRWKQFIHETIVDADGHYDGQLARIVQEWFGYCLVPQTKAQKAMVWSGEGGNGKGVATGVLRAIIGEENVVGMDITSLDREYDRAQLRDKLLGVTSETPTRGMITDSWFKAIVTGDLVPARLPHGRPFSFKPFVRLLITCNEIPGSADHTYAMLRRLVIVPWNARFDTGPNGTADPELEADLVEHELPGIFLWAVAGLARLAESRWRFTAATASERALESYRLEGNSVALWQQERTELDPGARVDTAVLYADYAKFCEGGNLRPYGIAQFPRRLKELLGASIAKADGKHAKGWKGIKLCA